MIQNLKISSENGIKIDKNLCHLLVSHIKKDLDFSIVSLPINFIFSGTILEINKKYLNHHFTTDIITFNYSGENKELDGELYISIDDALENSKQFDNTLDEELLRLIIHGILHLLGFDDMTPDDKKIMKAKENELVLKYKYLLNNQKIYVQ